VGIQQIFLNNLNGIKYKDLVYLVKWRYSKNKRKLKNEYFF